MNKFLKVCAIVGLCMALVGGIFLAVGMAIAGRDAWEQAKNGAWEELEQEFGDEVKSLDISLAAGEVIIRKGDVLKVTRYGDGSSFSCYLKGDTLVIEESNKNHWPGISLFGIHITGDGIRYEKRKVVVEIPENMTFENVRLNVDAGSIQADSLSLSGSFYGDVDAGSIQIEQLTAGDWFVDVDAGSFQADTVSVVGKTDLDVDAGSIKVEEFSGKETKMDCDVGSIKLTGEILGHVDAECDAGTISMKLSGIRERYHYTGSSELGTITIGGTRLGDFQNTNGQGSYIMTLKCDVGTIEIKER